MKTIIILCLTILFISCKEEPKIKASANLKLGNHATDFKPSENMLSGYSYLSVYSEIYDLTDETKHLLTSTISIRNTSVADTLFITKADYFNTKGEKIRSYLETPIFLTPLETTEIVIQRRDDSGGSGANFVFDWAIKNNATEPLFEAVMIWTTGTQGISFVTHGVNYPNK